MGKKTKKGVPKIDRSQTFSMDILVALAIFIAGIVIFLFLINGNADNKTGDKLVSEAESLPQKLIASDEYSSTNTTIVIGNKVDSWLLNRSLSKNYTALKRELDLVNNFCIHFEDDNGNVVDLNEDPCKVQYSMGDPRLMLTIKDQSGTETTVACGSIEIVC